MNNLEKNTQTTELKHDELKNVQGGGIIDLIEGAVKIYDAAKRFIDSLGSPQA